MAEGQGWIDKVKALLIDNPDRAPGELPVGTSGADREKLINDRLYEMENGRKRAGQSTDKANGY